MALWRHMTTQMWVNIATGIELLPDGTKPLPIYNIDSLSVKYSNIDLRAILQEMPQP